MRLEGKAQIKWNIYKYVYKLNFNNAIASSCLKKSYIDHTKILTGKPNFILKNWRYKFNMVATRLWKQITLISWRILKRNDPLLIIKTFIKNLNNLNNLNLKNKLKDNVKILVKLEEILFLSMVKNITTSSTSQNKNLNGQHHFLPFKVANIVVQSANNGLNPLQTKVNTSKQAKLWKQIPT